MVKRVTAAALALAAVMSLSACGDVDESSSKKEKSAAAQSERSVESIDESVKADESSKTDESSKEDDPPAADESSEEEPKTDLPTGGAETVDDLEKLTALVLRKDGDTAIAGLDKLLGISHGEPVIYDGLMNAAGQRYENYFYAFDEGYELLGQRLYRIDLDCVSDDKTVFTVGFHMNTDINTHEGHEPEWQECKEAYESIYQKLFERYGEPDEKFTPEVNDYFGCLWKDTPCGEIWISWAERIFGSEQPDLIISFSRLEAENNE